MTKEDAVVRLVYSICAENPTVARQIIDAATEGVKVFADGQSDKSTKMAFMMCQILDDTTNPNFGPFSRKEIFEYILPWFKGTKWAKEQMEKMGIKPPEPTNKEDKIS
jgi:hypothetical protein